MDVEKIRNLVAQGKYEFSKHAERERELDMIYVWELEDALKNCEIIEDYPEDSPRSKLSDFGVLWCQAHSCSLYNKN